jgi:outer membrane protein OmpA-like peptidoglycan-associated protein
VELATQAEDRLLRLTEEKSDWIRMAKARQAQLSEVSQLADETAYELAKRKEREEKIKAAQQLLTVSEGVVLYNDNNDIVLRLTGLSFEPGESALTGAHRKILGKVEEILRQFPGHGFVVEGHTDARGNPAGNLTLSQKRAGAVRDHLLKSLALEAEAIRAEGFGDARPVASNSSSDGRAKNRRIDIVILQ